jgi:hypothetical protein
LPVLQENARPNSVFQPRTLFAYLTREPKQPTWKTTLGCVSVMGVGGVAIMRPPIIDKYWLNAPAYSSALMVFAWSVLILAPSIVTAVAVIQTQSWLDSDLCNLLRLSYLPRRVLIRNHILTLLFRLRVLVGLLVGLTPALFAGMFHRTYVWSLGLNNIWLYPLIARAPWTVSVHLFAWRTYRIGWMPQFYGWGISTWGMLLLGAVIGAGSALRLRQQTLALTVAVPLVFLATLIPMIALPFMPFEGVAPWIRVVMALALAGLPFVMAMGIMRRAARWV